MATQTIADYLSRRGNEVHVVTLRHNLFKKNTVPRSYQVHHIYRPKIKGLGYLVFSVQAFSEVRKINPDCVHVQGLGLAWIGYATKLIKKTPYMVYGRGSEFYHSNIIKESILVWGARHANTVVALTPNMKKSMMARGVGDVEVIPNGINAEEFRDLDKNISRELLGLEPSAKIILSVARLNRVKGTEFLIRAIRIVIDKTSVDITKNLKVILVGKNQEKGDYYSSLIKSLDLEEYIILTGDVPRDMVPVYMKASDIFILPSLSEGFPNVILEAMAAGLPIITTNVSGLPNIVHDNINGFIVEPSNEDQIADRLRQLVTDETLCSSFSNQNLIDVQAYNWEIIVDELERLYRMMMAV